MRTVRVREDNNIAGKNSGITTTHNKKQYWSVTSYGTQPGNEDSLCCSRWAKKWPNTQTVTHFCMNCFSTTQCSLPISVHDSIILQQLKKIPIIFQKAKANCYVKWKIIRQQSYSATAKWKCISHSNHREENVSYLHTTQHSTKAVQSKIWS